MLQAIANGELSGDLKDGQTDVRAAKYAMLRRIQHLAGHAIIRRTHESVGPTGPLIQFPPKRMIAYYLPLPVKEQRNLVKIAKAAVDEKPKNRRVIQQGGVGTPISFKVSGPTLNPSAVRRSSILIELSIGLSNRNIISPLS